MTAFEKLNQKHLILGSASPRRQTILKMQGLVFDICVSRAEEKSNETQPEKIVLDIATQKANNVRKQLESEKQWNENSVLVCADTVVVYEEKIFGKPRDRLDAKRMLQKFSGNPHEVMTAVAVVYQDRTLTACEKTKVLFAQLSDEEIEAYLNKNDYADKAGAYAIQGFAAPFVKRIEGDYYNVVGFPVRRFYEMINEMI